jgi:hypothetical protein
MRVSEYYHLKRGQPELDFVDVDIYGDVRIYVDPRALRLLPSRWGDECVSMIQKMFSKQSWKQSRTAWRQELNLYSGH